MTVNAGAQLDRLPMSRFHRRIMWLIGIGMFFFDGFDIYIASGPCSARRSRAASRPSARTLFVSITFLGMMIGSRSTPASSATASGTTAYQANLAL